MKIGIIGAGHIGGTLTRRLRALGHDVSVANSRGPETLKPLADETGAHAVKVTDAARGQGVVIVTIPEKGIPDLPKDLFDAERATRWSWTPATTTRSATAASRQSRTARRRADGSRSSSAGP